MSAFEKALEKTLRHEGGYVNDPADPGGETNFGISKRAYPDIDFKALTREQASKVYHIDYWIKPGWGRLENDDLAIKLFDLGVNCGTFRAAQFLQRALTLLGLRTPDDGIVGAQTIALANGVRHPEALLMAVRYFAAKHYAAQNQPRFIAGWLARLAE